MAGNNQPVAREPRVGVDQERLDGLGIDLARTACETVRDAVATPAQVVSIINISLGGIKIVVRGAVRDPKLEDKITLAFQGTGSTWNLRGRVAWAEKLGNDQWWVGVELAATADAMTLFKALTAD